MKGIEATVALPMDKAEELVREALSGQGFGVLTEIDVSATLKAKLDIERSPLKILGACNPNFAHRALQIDPSVSLALPCNVVLEPDGESATRVVIADPRELLGSSGDPSSELSELGQEAADMLEKVADSLRSA